MNGADTARMPGGAPYGVLGSERFFTFSGLVVSAALPSVLDESRVCGCGRRNAAAEIMRGGPVTEGVEPVPPERLYIVLVGGGARGVLAMGARYASIEGDGEVRGRAPIVGGLSLPSLRVGDAGVGIDASGIIGDRPRAGELRERSRART